jgi:hypothetical protein
MKRLARCAALVGAALAASGCVWGFRYIDPGQTSDVRWQELPLKEGTVQAAERWTRPPAAARKAML